MSSRVTTSIAAGASRAFSTLRDVVTVIGLSLGALLGGAILTETIFNLTGLGKTMAESIFSRDFIVIQAFTVIIETKSGVGG